MDCNALDLLLASGRIAVLVVGMLAGMLCVYLGAGLYKEGVRSHASGEVSFKSIRVALTAASPGVFLALFGAYLMVAIVNRPLDMQDRQELDPEGQNSPAVHEAPRGARLHSPFFLKTQAVASAPQRAPRCLVREKRRSLMSGENLVDTASADESLRLAVTVLEGELDKASDPETQVKYRKAISVLDELRAGLVR